jgi:hypothetical protein
MKRMPSKDFSERTIPCDEYNRIFVDFIKTIANFFLTKYKRQDRHMNQFMNRARVTGN